MAVPGLVAMAALAATASYRAETVVPRARLLWPLPSTGVPRALPLPAMVPLPLPLLLAMPPLSPLLLPADLAARPLSAAMAAMVARVVLAAVRSVALAVLGARPLEVLVAMCRSASTMRSPRPLTPLTMRSPRPWKVSLLRPPAAMQQVVLAATVGPLMAALVALAATASFPAEMPARARRMTPQ